MLAVFLNFIEDLFDRSIPSDSFIKIMLIFNCDPNIVFGFEMLIEGREAVVAPPTEAFEILLDVGFTSLLFSLSLH